MKQNGFKWLVNMTLILSLCVVALGAYTRLTEAGLGCPDWPGCYGFVAVPDSEAEQATATMRFPDSPLEPHKAWNEMLHRYVAGALGILILIINIMAWRRPEQPKLIPGLLLVTVIFQALLGMWTVTMVLMPVVVLGHLLGGFTTVSLLLLLRLRLMTVPSPVRIPSAENSVRAGRRLQILSLFGLVVVIAQIGLGGWTAANYAAMVCTQLPVCEVDWLQGFDMSAFAPIQPVHDSYQYGVLNFQQRVSIHASHRIGAMITTVLLLVLGWRLWLRPVLRPVALVMLVVLAVQVGLGITNVVASLPLAVAVAHNVTGVMLLLTLVMVNMQVYRQRWVTCYGTVSQSD
ncbi:COX15/CtaA family protein [Photobacterium nomapromontoriensis]|uniref:COX15/CtaA family protein n=1 Tax=Photobacterium nomapromontoriensis TaxID=2910237 RepID=UPI003D0D9616